MGLRALPTQQVCLLLCTSPPISFENIFLLAHPSHASQCHAAVSPPHSAFTAADISPALPHPALLTPRSCPLRAPPAPPGASPASANAGVPSRTSGRSLQSQGHPRAGGARTLPLDAGSYFEVRINWPWPFPTPMLQIYVSSVLGVIRGMLQVFRMDVVKVDHDVTYVASVSEACRKCFRGMLQAFVQNVLDVCCKRFF